MAPLPAAATRLVLVAVPEGVPLVDASRTTQASPPPTAEETHLTAGLLQALYQLARDIDQGEIGVIHFGQPAGAGAGAGLPPRSPSARSTLSNSGSGGSGGGGGGGGGSAGGRFPGYSGTPTSSLRAQMARAVAVDESTSTVQSLVTVRQEGVLFGLIFVSPKTPERATVEAMRQVLANVAGDFGSICGAGLEPLRQAMRAYRNGTDAERDHVTAAVEALVAPFVQATLFTGDHGKT